MKVGAAFLLAILGGCASAARPAPPVERPAAADVRGEADALRVEHEYRPAPMGSEVLMVSYDHPPRAYYPASWCYYRKGFYGKGFYGYSPYRPRCD